MAANTKVLLAGLEEYYQSLQRHLSQLQQDFQQLDRRWRAFSAVYEGDAADQFRAGWQRSTAMFQDYVNQTQRIAKILEERIASLRETNKPEGSF